MRRFAFLLAVALAACATPLTPINAPLAGAQALTAARTPAGEDLIVLALSGGGARSASFSLGALQALRDMRGDDGRPLSEHIALVTAVSGGAILAAYYGLNGEAGLDTFRAAYLDQRWDLNGPASLRGFAGALRGGMNSPARAAAWLDRELYHGARMGAMTAGPRIVINATDLYNSTPFAFTPLFFDAICGDLAGMRVSDAVAASMAVPVAFSPALAESRAGCAPAPAWLERVRNDRATPELVRATAGAFENYGGDTSAAQRYLHLSDGGVVDNFGVTSLMVMRAAGPAPAPLTTREALQARRVLVLVVNGERVRPRTFQTRPNDLGPYEMLYSPLDASTDAAKRAALDALRASLPDFERELRQFRCGRDAGAAPSLGSDWRCEDITLSMEVISFRDLGEARAGDLYAAATQVSLPRERVDALIAAGRDAVNMNAAVRALTRN